MKNRLLQDEKFKDDNQVHAKFNQRILRIRWIYNLISLSSISICNLNVLTGLSNCTGLLGFKLPFSIAHSHYCICIIQLANYVELEVIYRNEMHFERDGIKEIIVTRKVL